MRKHFFFLGLVVYLLSSCNFNGQITSYKSKPSEINIYIYNIPVYRENKFVLRDSIFVLVDTIYSQDKKIISYKKDLEDSICFNYSYSIINDSFYFFNDYCPIIDTVTIDNEFGKIELLKSELDNIYECDEEMYIYWNNKYGAIVYYSYIWDDVTIFDNSEIPNFSKECIMEYIVFLKEKERQRLLKSLKQLKD